MTTSSATLVGRREGCAFGCLHNSCCLWGDRRLASSVANPTCPGPLMVALKYVPSAFQTARPCHLPATFSPPVFSLRTGKVRSTYPCLLPSRLRLMNLRQASFPFRCALSSSSSSRPVMATALLLLYSILPSTQKTPLYSGLPSSQGLALPFNIPSYQEELRTTLGRRPQKEAGNRTSSICSVVPGEPLLYPRVAFLNEGEIETKEAGEGDDYRSVPALNR